MTLKNELVQYLQKKISLIQTKEPDSLNPLALVGRYFREDRLRRALCISVCPGQSTGSVSDALEATGEAEESNQAVDVGVLAPCQDQRSRWWAAALAAGAHWVRREAEEAEKLYHAVEAFPVGAGDIDGPVFEAIYACFESQRAMMELAAADDAEEADKEHQEEEEEEFESEERAQCRRIIVGRLLNGMDQASALLEEAVEHVVTHQQQQHKEGQKKKPVVMGEEESAVLRVRKVPVLFFFPFSIFHFFSLTLPRNVSVEFFRCNYPPQRRQRN